ncbi:MAG: MFS transporter [Gammaproteobacteria bacterium]|nr:MFS transporter [Gammaproteobacteria bacterium]NNJ95536.1 MFS transporter [Gammaproteobacteria bacterium]
MSEQGKPEGQLRLLRERRFLPFFVTQFLGAFNDNVFKNALIILIAFQGAQFSDIDTNTLTNLSAGLFILPFFLLSATAGQLIDKTDKSLSMQRIKMLEIGIMLCAAWAFHAGELYLLIALLFLMGAQSTLFGPAKYSYIPQHLADNELVAGNALVQMGTFVAILIGTMAGGLLIAHQDGRVLVSVVLVVIAVFGFIASLVIPKTPAPCPDLKINWNLFSETWRNIAFLHSNRTVFLSVLGISWFWFLGATYLVQLPNYTKLTLGANEQVVTLLLTLFTLGIGSGSLLCNWLSGQKVEIGLVPFGSIGLTLFGIDLFFARPTLEHSELIGLAAFWQQAGSFRIIFDVVLIGLFGGFYIVPLFALVQQRSDKEHLSRVIAGNNILNALLMVLSATLAIVLLGAGVSIAQLFLIVAILNAAVAVYIFTLVPEFLMRFLVWILIHSIYHVRKQGLENIPDQGPAVLVCNHVSYVDAMIIGGCIRRPVRFVMYYKIYQLPLLHFVSRTARAIPIAGGFENKALMEQAFDQVEQALQEGDVVCIFPEGRLTSDGQMNQFKSGIERIVKRMPVPVIPMCLYGLWGSAFSRHRGFILWRIINGFRSTIDLTISKPQPPQGISAQGLQAQVADMCVASARARGY